MQQFDFVVVGGGIIGLAVAWTIIQRDPKVRIAVLEKEDAWARHQTGRNSGVIHSGIYYQPGSLKAKLCRAGNLRMLRFCQEHGIPYDVCGKVIVATAPAELALLENLHQRGVANGLKVQRLSAAQVAEIEPHVRCLAGIQVPSTGIVDFASVCRKLADLIQSRGGDLRLSTKVLGFKIDSREAVLETPHGALTAQ
jgi:(S)-2-hydroxyglutarate dehydrogenase